MVWSSHAVCPRSHLSCHFSVRCCNVAAERRSWVVWFGVQKTWGYSVGCATGGCMRVTFVRQATVGSKAHWISLVLDDVPWKIEKIPIKHTRVQQVSAILVISSCYGFPTFHVKERRCATLPLEGNLLACHLVFIVHDSHIFPPKQMWKESACMLHGRPHVYVMGIGCFGRN